MTHSRCPFRGRENRSGHLKCDTDFLFLPLTESEPLTDFISESPHVVLKGVDVMKTKMWVLWQYSPSTRRSKGKKDTCSIQIQYRTMSNKEYKSDGTKVSAEMVTCVDKCWPKEGG